MHVSTILLKDAKQPLINNSAFLTLSRPFEKNRKMCRNTSILRDNWRFSILLISRFFERKNEENYVSWRFNIKSILEENYNCKVTKTRLKTRYIILLCRLLQFAAVFLRERAFDFAQKITAKDVVKIRMATTNATLYYTAELRKLFHSSFTSIPQLYSIAKHSEWMEDYSKYDV